MQTLSNAEQRAAEEASEKASLQTVEEEKAEVDDLTQLEIAIGGAPPPKRIAKPVLAPAIPTLAASKIRRATELMQDAEAMRAQAAAQLEERSRMLAEERRLDAEAMRAQAAAQEAEQNKIAEEERRLAEAASGSGEKEDDGHGGAGDKEDDDKKDEEGNKAEDDGQGDKGDPEGEKPDEGGQGKNGEGDKREGDNGLSLSLQFSEAEKVARENDDDDEL